MVGKAVAGKATTAKAAGSGAAAGKSATQKGAAAKPMFSAKAMAGLVALDKEISARRKRALRIIRAVKK